MADDFTILAVVQRGRLEHEALLFMASLRASGNAQPVVLAEPQPGPLWRNDPRIENQALRAALVDLGAEIMPLHSRHFGSDYPIGNKIEAIGLLPDKPFVFFDTDTLFLGDLAQVPFDFSRPSASLRREASWPKAVAGWPGHAAVWGALYERFGLDFAASQEASRSLEDWQRYLYFNAGYFYHQSPEHFGHRFLEYALTIRDAEIAELTGQKLTPWLDQIALPLAVHAFGGGVDRAVATYLDGQTTCHYRTIPLLYARESEAALAMLERVCEMAICRDLLWNFDPIKAMVYQKQGRIVRQMFADAPADADEAHFRKALKARGLWLRE